MLLFHSGSAQILHSMLTSLKPSSDLRSLLSSRLAGDQWWLTLPTHGFY